MVIVECSWHRGPLLRACREDCCLSKCIRAGGRDLATSGHAAAVPRWARWTCAVHSE